MELLVEEACGWLARVESGNLSAEEQMWFDSWKGTSDAHQRAWDEACVLWNDPNLMRAAVHFTDQTLAQRSRHAFLRRCAVVVGLAILGGAMIAALLRPDHPDAQYTTRTGEQTRVTLADGTAVVLNTQTALAVDLSARNREARLLYGEAFFDVTQDAAHPFVVHHENVAVRVIGTKFSVRAEERVRVSVTDGNVELRTIGHQSRVIAAGEEVTVEAGRIGGIRPLHSASALAWTEGRLVVEDMPLEEVIAEIRRYHRGSIVLAGDAIRRTKVSGTFFLSDTRSLIETLTKTLPVRLIRVTDYLFVLY